jgi:hypothetical protein
MRATRCCSALPYGLLRSFRGQRGVQAAVGHRVDVGEFPPDHEHLLWTSRNIFPQPQGASPWHGDGARTLLHARKSEDPLSQLLHHLGLWIVLQLGVRVGRRCPRPGPAPLRQDALVHLSSTPACESVVGHTITLRKPGPTRYRFIPPGLRDWVAAEWLLSARRRRILRVQRELSPRSRRHRRVRALRHRAVPARKRQRDPTPFDGTTELAFQPVSTRPTGFACQHGGRAALSARACARKC